MGPQATRCTQKQLAYLAYWQARGHQFKRDERILEDTCIPPSALDKPRAIELIVTAAAIIAAGVWQYTNNA